MSARISPSTGRPYGVQRTCAAWGRERSFFSKTCPESCPDHEPPVPPKGKPSPKTEVCDAELLALIREDLDSSPFTGEGRSKVLVRLKYGRGIPISRKRVLSIMRETNLLSLHRVPRKPPYEHTGRIVTDEPNQIWEEAAPRCSRFRASGDGYSPAQSTGTQRLWDGRSGKRGDRFAACELVAQGLRSEFGSVEAGAARGLSLRTDHGSQYLSNHFQKQIRAWGMAPSLAFLEQPQAGGVVGRLLRTLKEQVIYGRVFKNLEEVRQAVSAFAELYNNQWLIEKNGYLSPAEAWKDCYEVIAA